MFMRIEDEKESGIVPTKICVGVPAALYKDLVRGDKDFVGIAILKREFNAAVNLSILRYMLREGLISEEDAPVIIVIRPDRRLKEAGKIKLWVERTSND
ncbi:MAG: hypothetical protein UW69_C0007G0008 [Microgenomates group bacterium GW2011_GWA2_44_7]|nr:MAG: hypothetical protein UW69_C0007G0008 [Microgenomates group bacterium GW2011_GWA2_44_7]